MANLRSGRLDVLFPTSKTEDRLQYMVYSERPVNEVRFRVYVPRDAELDWRGLDSLAGMRIGAMRGWNYGDEWRAASGFEKYPLSGIEQGFNMLEAGRLDGFAGYEIHWDYALHRMGQADQYRKLPVFGSKKEFVTALKENPGVANFWMPLMPANATSRKPAAWMKSPGNGSNPQVPDHMPFPEKRIV